MCASLRWKLEPVARLTALEQLFDTYSPLLDQFVTVATLAVIAQLAALEQLAARTCRCWSSSLPPHAGSDRAAYCPSGGPRSG